MIKKLILKINSYILFTRFLNFNKKLSVFNTLSFINIYFFFFV